LKALSSQWEVIILDMYEQTISSRLQLEHDMVGMCLDLCAHFLRVTAAQNEVVLTKVIQEALSLIDKNSPCDVLVSQGDFELYERSDMLQSLLNRKGIAVGVESTIRSGCIVKTEFETLNFDIQAAFERVALEFQGEK